MCARQKANNVEIIFDFSRDDLHTIDVDVIGSCVQGRSRLVYNTYAPLRYLYACD